MRYLGSGIGHKSTWPSSDRQQSQDHDDDQVHEDNLGNDDEPEDGQAFNDAVEGGVIELGDDDEENYNEDLDQGDSDEEHDYGYVNDVDVDNDDDENGETDEDEDLGPEDGEDNWEADEWEVEGYAPM